MGARKKWGSGSEQEEDVEKEMEEAGQIELIRRAILIRRVNWPSTTRKLKWDRFLPCQRRKPLTLPNREIQ